MKKKVYVSSTFVDLERHRAELKAALERAQYDAECMEKYPAFDQRPTDKCLEDVAACDYYVLILAHCYGFVPKADNPDKRSITELEYEEAKATGKPCLAFLVEEDHPWNPKLIDKGAAAKKLAVLRDEVRERHGAPFFTTPEDLVSKVLQALRNQEERERAEGRGAPATPSPGLSGWRWPAAWDFAGYMEERRRDFVGRDWLFGRIDDWIQAGTSRALLVRADYGVGKSALLAELVRRKANGALAAWYFCQHDTRDTLLPATFVSTVVAQLAETVPGYREAIEATPALRDKVDRVLDDPPSTFEAAIVSPLHRLPPPSVPRLLIVDAPDESLEVDPETARRQGGTLVTLLAAKAGRLPSWLRILATSRDNSQAIRPLQQAFAVQQLDAESQENLRDIRDYVLGRCRKEPVSSRLRDARMAPESVAEILETKSQGKFLYAARALQDLANGNLAPVEFAELPPGMDGFYRDAFERRFERTGRPYEPVRDLLGLLAAAREPLPPDVLAEILSVDESSVKHSLGLLPDFLRVRGGRYGFDHVSLAQWLTLEDEHLVPRAGPYTVDLQAAERRLHDWAIERVEAGCAHERPYLVRHLAAHLTAGERARFFGRLMFELPWLDAKLRTVGVQALIADATFLDRERTNALLVAALRNSSRALGREPAHLSAQLIGRLKGRQESGLEALVAEAQATGLARRPSLCPLTPSLRLTQSLIATLHGHRGGVRALAALPDGRLASGSDDNTVRVWDPSGRAAPLVLSGHQSSITALAVLPDGRLASGSWDRTVRVWDPSGRAAPLILSGHEDPIIALAVLPDGRLASGSDDKTVRVWDPSGHAVPLVLSGHESSVWALAVLPDGRLASGSDDKTVRVWDPSGRAEPLVLSGHENPMNALAALPDGRLASGSDDKTVRVWDPSGRAAPLILSGHQDRINALAVLPDGRLASGSSDNTVRVWDPSGRAEPLVLSGHQDRVNALAVLPDGRLASVSSDNTVRVWDPSGRAAPLVLSGHEDSVGALVGMPDGRLASGSRDHTVRVWDPSGHGEPLVLSGHRNYVTTLAVLPDGRLASGSWDSTVRVWDPSGHGEPLVLSGHQNYVTTLAVLPDGRLASGSWDSTVRVWDPSGHGEPLVLFGHQNQIWALAVLPDGRLASGSWDNTVRVWDPSGRAEPLVLSGHARWIMALAALLDGRLASGSLDGTVRVWDPSGRAKPLVLSGHEDSIIALAVLPDGRVASGSEDKTVRVWDPSGRAEPLVFSGHEDSIIALAVLPDGRVASGSEDKTVRVWDPSGRAEPLVFSGHEGLISALAVLPDGRVASGSEDRTVRIWDICHGREVVAFTADASILCLAVRPDGLIVAGDRVGCVHFLRLAD